MNALIVDDDPIIRLLGSKMLESKGYDVKAVADEKELRSYLAEVEVCPDLIMLDLQIGDLMGPEAIDIITAKFQITKLVCMSSHTAYEAEELFPTLVNHINFESNFIQKPFNSAALFELLGLS